MLHFTLYTLYTYIIHILYIYYTNTSNHKLDRVALHKEIHKRYVK